MVGQGTAGSLSSNALPIGTRIHEFEITRVIGEGGFSVVYLAFDHILHRSIALKEYIPSVLASRRSDNTVAVRSTQHQQTFEAGLRSFINEARLLAQFDHPALVKVYRFWEANGTAYMAMPYYEGRTLKQILRENPEQATEAWLKQLLSPLLEALELLHGHRCYHRDIAPDNIQILDNEAPVLLDFGAARRTIGDMTQAFTVILKPGYAPIEQYADETDLKQGPWTDVYALAAVLYGAVVRKPPPTAVARVIKDPLVPLARQAPAGYGVAFLYGIDRGLGVRPEERPQSIGEWRAMLGVEARHVPAEPHGRSPLGVGSRSAPSAREVRAPPTGVPVSEPSRAKREEESQSDELSNERDRTVLVPGLRRSLQQVRGKVQVPPASGAGKPGERVLPPVTARYLRLPVLASAGAIIAGLVALIAINPFGGSTPAVPSQASNAGVDGRPPSPNPGASSIDGVSTAPDRPLTPSGETTAPVPLPAMPGSPKPSTSSTTLPPSAPGNPPSGAGTSAESTSSSTSAATAPAPNAKALPSPPPAAPVAEDDRQWAAISDSHDIADFYAFQLKFENSPHTAAAAARIKELERAERPQPRPKSAAPVDASESKTAFATAERKSPVDRAERPQPRAERPQPRPKAAMPLEAAENKTASVPAAAERTSPQNRTEVSRPPATAMAAKPVVRIRVRPFGYVYVDGALIGPSPPVQEVPLSLGKHRIEARNPEARPGVIAQEIQVDGTSSQDIQLRFNE